MRTMFSNKVAIAAISAVLVAYCPQVVGQTERPSDMVLELQAVRSEIAELRDMLERQQFEIRRLEKQVDESRSAASPSSSNTVAEANLDPSYINFDLPKAVLKNEELAAEPLDPNLEKKNEALNQDDASLRVINAPAPEEPQLVEPHSDADYYRTGPRVESLPVENPEVASAAIQAGDLYPPIIDRSIEPTSAESPLMVESISEDTDQKPEVSKVGVIQIPSLIATQQITEDLGKETEGTGSVVTETGSSPINISVPEEQFYQQGFDLLKEFKYPEAVSVFEQQIAQYPDGSYADDAHYWIAESMYLNRNLGESKKYFRAIIDNFEQSPRVPDAMLKTAYIEREQGNEIEARILLQEIIQYHPRSDAAISAKNRLEKLN